eukprot:CAMPEP_0178425550 /NCGR_PEP_ID=MMETSP0689_2-20121128/28780_1 /TAXON_ID=160604 /ORGANISM="Amphidinium massartii, Strain CS-259" /LENGTH=507 /DNA_ID=CAMNT_0020047215 /DNA_START=42 /DNA_END=1565 /DNA_ORIENTATION=-
MTPCPRWACLLGAGIAVDLRDAAPEKVGQGGLFAPRAEVEPRIEWLHTPPSPAPQKRRPKRRKRKKALKRKTRDRYAGVRKGPLLNKKVYRTKRRKKRKRKRRDRPPSWPKKYGLLRHFVSKWPWWFARLEVLFVYSFQLLASLGLVLGFLVEASVGVTSPWASSSKQTLLADHRGAPWRLGAMAIDVALPMLAALQTWLWLLGFPCLPDFAWTFLRRLAVLQSMAASTLHVTTVVRWKFRPGHYQAPPLFVLLAYFVLPWCCMCVWLVSMEPGDYAAGGDAGLDVSVLAAVFALRAVLCGRRGLPRVPRAPRRREAWLLDALILWLLAAIFDYGILRNHWFEDKKNWKYVFCAMALVLAWCKAAAVMDFCRQEVHEVRHPSKRTTMASSRSSASGQKEIGSRVRPRRSLKAQEGGAAREAIPAGKPPGPWGVAYPGLSAQAQEEPAAAGRDGPQAGVQAEDIAAAPKLPVLGPEDAVPLATMEPSQPMVSSPTTEEHNEQEPIPET